MTFDASILNNINTVDDYNRLSQEFLLKKQIAAHRAQGTHPAALQIADALKVAQQNGDTRTINNILLGGKLADKGLIQNPDGTYMAAAGYGNAVGNIGAIKKGMEEQAQKDVQAVMNPIIAGGEANAKNASEVSYAAPKAAATATGAATGAAQGNNIKAAFTAQRAIPLLENAKGLLGNASGGGISALYQNSKGLAGISDKTTQANNDLEMLAGYLTSNVPRMEGPQSDRDAINYAKMAGQLGNKSIPVGDRMSTLNKMLGMQAYYSGDPEQIKKYPDYDAGGPKIIEENIPNGNKVYPAEAAKMNKYQQDEKAFNDRKTVRKSGSNPRVVHFDSLPE